MQLLQSQLLNFDGGVIQKGEKLTTLVQNAFLTLHRRGVEINHSFSTLSHSSLRFNLVILVVILFHSFVETTNKNIRSLWMGMCAIHSCCCATADAFYEVNLMCSSSKQSAVRKKKNATVVQNRFVPFPRWNFTNGNTINFLSTFVNIHNEIIPVLQILCTSQMDTEK